MTAGAIPSYGATVTLKMGGTGADLGAMRQLAEAYHQLVPGTVIDIQSSIGSTGGIRGVAAGVLDIGLSSRLLKDAENVLGVKELHYATTPFVFVTDQDAAQTQLDSSEILSIYDGRKTRWNDGTPVKIILRPETEADTILIQKYIPGMREALVKAYARRGPPIAITDQDAVDKVQMIKGAVGLSTMSLILGEHRPLKALSFNGIAPTVENLANGSYPMSKNLYLVIGPQPKAEVLRFIGFIFSAQGKNILNRTGHLALARQAMPDKP